MTPRRRARCVAMQVLYALDGVDVVDPSAGTCIAPAPVRRARGGNRSDARSDFQLRAAENDAAPIAPFDEELAVDLIRGVCTHRAEIDELLARLSRKWRVERLARVDRTILRMGIYELGHRKDTPARVALSEAIELAKRFGAEEAPAFVNGLLDSALELLGQRP
jgi:N utilization substance protein B